jgi:hypothetical protein
MPVRFACAVFAAVVLAACGDTGHPAAAGTPASSSAGASPTPVPPYGVFVKDFFVGQNGYQVFLVRADGTVAASATARNRAYGGGLPDLPVVSITSDRVYYLDGGADVRYLTNRKAPGGLAYQIPVKANQIASFAVSPDDLRIAYTLIDYSARPYAMRLFVDDLAGGKLNDLFSSTSVYEWPVGWQQGHLVLAVSSISQVQNAGEWFMSSSGFHVVDAATATRLNSICTDVGSSTPFPISSWGTPCSVTTSTNGVSKGDYSVVSWDGVKKPVLAQDPCPSTGPPSPDGALVAVQGSDRVCKSTANDPMRVLAFDGSVKVSAAVGTPLGWLDNNHLVSQADLPANSRLAPSAAPIFIAGVPSSSSVQVAVTGLFVGTVPAASS